MSKRANGEGSIYRRSDGRWVGSMYVWNREGGRQRKSVYGRTRSEVAKKLAEVASDTAQRIPAAPDRVTVEEYGRKWLRQNDSRWKPSTSANYRWVLETFVFPQIGTVRVQRLSTEHVANLLTNVSGLAARRVPDGSTAKVSARTVQLTRTVLRTMLASAEREQIVRRNVASLVAAPRVEREEIDPWSLSEAMMFLDSLAGHQWEMLFRVAVALGLRKGELVALRWSDVDLENGILRVTRTAQRVTGAGLVVNSPKSKRSRRAIVVPPSLVAGLRRHKLQQAADRRRVVAAGDSWEDNGLVFTTQNGRMIEPRYLNTFFEARIKTAGVRRIRFHDLRHTCATLLFAKGVQPRVVMEVLGHSQMSLTTDLYGHVLPPLLESAAEAMNDVAGGDDD